MGTGMGIQERQRIQVTTSVIAVLIAVLAGVNIFGLTGKPAEHGLAEMTLIAIECAAVLLRLRHPVVSWGVCLVALLVFPADHQSWYSVAGLAQLAMLHLVSETNRRNSGLIGVATFTVLWGAEIRTPSFELVSGDTATAVVWTAGIAALGIAIRSRLDYATAIEDRARLAGQTRDAEIRTRVAEERLRIARELHDVLGHHVAVIRVHAGLARRTLISSPERAGAALAETEKAAQAVLREMSGILRLLREDQADRPDQESPAPAPGLSELNALIETVRHSGLKIVVTQELDPTRVTELVAVTAYRVVQECLTNAQRHSIGTLGLTLRTDTTTLTIVAENPTARQHTPGEKSLSSGYGLIGMRERVRAVGGHLEISSTEKTFRVEALLPLDTAMDFAQTY